MASNTSYTDDEEASKRYKSITNAIHQIGAEQQTINEHRARLEKHKARNKIPEIDDPLARKKEIDDMRNKSSALIQHKRILDEQEEITLDLYNQAQENLKQALEQSKYADENDMSARQQFKTIRRSCHKLLMATRKFEDPSELDGIPETNQVDSQTEKDTVSDAQREAQDANAEKLRPTDELRKRIEHLQSEQQLEIEALKEQHNSAMDALVAECGPEIDKGTIEQLQAEHKSRVDEKDKRQASRERNIVLAYRPV